MWTCKRVILFSESVNILFFSVDMDNEIETLIQTHMYRHGHLVCQACFKSCEKRFLKRDNFQEITDIQNFVIMLKIGRKRSINLTPSKVTFLENH